MSIEPNTTPIAGRAVPYADDVIDLEYLHFWEDNPRVSAAVQGLREWRGANPIHRQVLMEQCMKQHESTQSVLNGLRFHNGQQEPLIVDSRENVVIDGNSRLAAMRILAEENPGHWGAAICRCYNDLSEEERFALIAELHVVGKTEWSPYAKAITYRRQRDDLEWELAKIARVNRTNVAKVKAELATVDLMARENELDERKYSWYSVVTSVRAVRTVFERSADFRARILEVIRETGEDGSDPVARASNTFRDAVTSLVKKERPLRQFCTGRRTLQEASDEARLTSLTVKLRKGRDVLGSIDQTDFGGLASTELGDAKSTFRRLRKDVDRIGKWFEEAKGKA